MVGPPPRPRWGSLQEDLLLRRRKGEKRGNAEKRLRGGKETGEKREKKGSKGSREKERKTEGKRKGPVPLSQIPRSAPAHSCKFPIEKIMGARNLNFAVNFFS